MPVPNSKRSDAIAQLVAVLAAVTAGATFGLSFNAPLQVASTLDTDDMRIALGAPFTLRIWDADEKHERMDITRGYSEGQLALFIDVLLKHTSGAASNLMAELNAVLRDIHMALNLNPTLNNAVDDVRVESIEPPFYDTDRNLASTLVRVAVIYTYQAGLTI